MGEERKGKEGRMEVGKGRSEDWREVFWERRQGEEKEVKVEE